MDTALIITALNNLPPQWGEQQAKYRSHILDLPRLLILAAEDGCAEMVEIMASQLPFADETMDKIMSVAVERGNVEFFQALLPYCPQKIEKSIWELCGRRGQLGCIQILVANVPTEEHIGSALRQAAIWFKDECVEYLMPLSADRYLQEALGAALGIIMVRRPTPLLLIDHIKTRGFVVWKEALQQAVWARNDLFIEQLVNASTPEIVAEVWRETQKRYPESGLQPFYQAQCERQALTQAVEHIVAAPHRSGARKL